jgi:glycosyltransferase involved in cell wall biosynthesis
MARADELRRELDLPKDVLVIGFVGRLTRDKGIPELMEAYWNLRNDFRELRLLLVGDFEDGDPVPLSVRGRIENDSHILRSGFVPDTSAYYQLMDVLVLPTWREGFGLVNIEAQAAGKPVVTTRATGTIDSVQDGKTGILVPVGDVSALAHAIGNLLGDAEKRKEMGRRGQEWVTREFPRGKVLADLVREYNSLIYERLGPSGRRSKRL